MIIAAVLFGYVALLCTLAPRLLRSARWAERAPRLGIAAWQVLGVAALSSAVMAGLALVVPTVRISADLAGLLHACVMALRAQYASPGGAAAGAAGAVLALAVLGRTAYCLGAAVLRVARERTQHREVLDLVGRPDAGRGLVVLDHDEPLVYCLPGRHRRTVITTGALRALDDAQVEAVLAHERAHLAERHDAVLAWAGALARAFPRVPLFCNAEAEVARLVEMRADDVAAARAGRLTTAAALLAVAASGSPYPVPAAALAAGGSTAARRVHRLIEPHRPLGRARATAGSLAVAVAIALPVLVLGGPAAAAMQMNYCPDATPMAAGTVMR
ncbi:M56 family metallopeptidase [Streptomyces sp. H10-C2]|uniref:M56 family metallopeptidase n=1 Tax=unclassified Streptomyces TaxID=2593676 RepID=UPI0024BB4C0D|nr:MULTISPECIES: M56 family metallopeptidase [unclassified Streptomyces]MDJ0341046.1 M56 family metallopeptidase [Streptomyces sp. PH10-H1]MDJ0369722.1 M56 family metallopeptidase [Streptomyces sp. H10-C2]